MAGSKKTKAKKPVAPPSIAPENDGLVDELLSQLDSMEETYQQTTTKPVDGPKDSSKLNAKGRFKARQARKAAALARSSGPDDLVLSERIEREAKEEERDINRVCSDLSLQMHEINPDGHCLFSAIADQLALIGVLPTSEANYTNVRKVAAEHMSTHPEDFIPFLPSGEDGQDGASDGFMTMEEFQRYCASIRETATWGGEPEILALSRAYNVPIHVVQAGQPSVVVHDPIETNGIKCDQRPVRISFHRRMYGLGEHYNSLRPKATLSHLSQKVHTILSS